MRRLMDRLALSLLLIPLFVAGCRQQKPAVDFDQPLPPGTLALRKLSPGEYPDFSRCTWAIPAAASFSRTWTSRTNGPSPRCWPFAM
jgi:hypothetical protein